VAKEISGGQIVGMTTTNGRGD